MSLHLHTEILRRQNLSFYLCFPITPCIIKTMSIIMTSFLYECAVNYLYRHYICFAENLSVAVVVNANILIIRRFKMGVTEKTAILVISFGTSYEETRKKQLNRLNLTCIMHFRNIRYTAHGQVPVSAPNSGSGTGSTLWILMRQ